MNAQQLINQYGELSDQGTFKFPGKFEGEPLYTAYFYDAMLQGDGEEIYQQVTDCHPSMAGVDMPDDWDLELICTEFLIDAFDIEACPSLEPYHGKYFRLFEDDYGFVSHVISDKRWYDE